jgi:hypothetical protein
MVSQHPGGSAVLAALLAVTVLAACNEPIDPVRDFDVELVLAIAATSASASWDSDEPLVQACPQGGRMIVQGATSLEEDGPVTVVRWDGVMRFEECGVPTRSAEAIVTGETQLEGEARFRQPTGGSGQGTLVLQESRQRGSITYLREGETGTCTFDLSHSFDPVAGEYHIAGTACGTPVDARMLPPPESGPLAERRLARAGARPDRLGVLSAGITPSTS